MLLSDGILPPVQRFATSRRAGNIQPPAFATTAREAHALSGLFAFMSDLLPLFLTLAGRDVLFVGGGTCGGRQAAGAGRRRRPRTRRRARRVTPEIERAGRRHRRGARSSRPISTAPGWSSRRRRRRSTGEVAAAAEARRIFVNAVDDPAQRHRVSERDGAARRRDDRDLDERRRAGADRARARGARRLLPRDLDRGWPKRAGSGRCGGASVPMAERKPRLLGRSTRFTAQGYGSGAQGRHRLSTLRARA